MQLSFVEAPHIWRVTYWDPAETTATGGHGSGGKKITKIFKGKDKALAFIKRNRPSSTNLKNKFKTYLSSQIRKSKTGKISTRLEELLRDSGSKLSKVEAFEIIKENPKFNKTFEILAKGELTAPLLSDRGRQVLDLIEGYKKVIAEGVKNENLDIPLFKEWATETYGSKKGKELTKLRSQLAYEYGNIKEFKHPEGILETERGKLLRKAITDANEGEKWVDLRNLSKEKIGPSGPASLYRGRYGKMPRL